MLRIELISKNGARKNYKFDLQEYGFQDDCDFTSELKTFCLNDGFDPKGVERWLKSGNVMKTEVQAVTVNEPVPPETPTSFHGELFTPEPMS